MKPCSFESLEMQVQYILTNWHIPNHSNPAPVGPRSGYSCRFPTFTFFKDFSQLTFFMGLCQSDMEWKYWNCKAMKLLRLILCLRSRPGWTWPTWGWSRGLRSLLRLISACLPRWWNICTFHILHVFSSANLVMINTNINMTMTEIIYLVGQLHN